MKQDNTPLIPGTSVNQTDPMTTETTSIQTGDSPKTVDENAPTREAVSDESTAGPDEIFNARVLVTGATGFVGRYVVRELVARGYTAVCVVRDTERLRRQASELPAGRVEALGGSLYDDSFLAGAAEGTAAVVHLVGIINERRLRGQTFERIHVEATRRVIDACRPAGVGRMVHMSALGARLHAASEYHRTKWAGESHVRESGLAWTILRPSIIHGHDGEFMRMMRTMICDATVTKFGFIPAPFPIVPYFGDGQNLVQPVSVRDVARCVVGALGRPETIGRTIDLGGPEAMSWKELYRVCRETMPGAKRWKPMVGQPVWLAKLMARTVMRLPILPRTLRFDTGQVAMSQEDSVCDASRVEAMFGVTLRDFRKELSDYAARIE